MTYIIFFGNAYLLCVLIGAVFWSASIYKTARVRQFALHQLQGQLGSLSSGIANEKNRKQETIRFILSEIRNLDRAFNEVRSSSDLNKAGIELVSVYILRTRLGIQTEIFTKLLARCSSRIIEKYIQRLDDVKKQVETEASEFNQIDRHFIVERFVSNLYELNQLSEPAVTLQPEAQLQEC